MADAAMVRARAIAISAAFLTLSSPARAQVTESQPLITEALRVQGGFITDAFPAPQPRRNDVWIGGVPEVTFFWLKPDATYSVDYQLAATLHSLGAANDIANRVTLLGAFFLSRRTTMLLGASASHSSINQLLINNGAPGATLTLLPTVTSTKVVTGGVTQALGVDVTSRLRFGQFAGVTAFTALAPSPPLDSLVPSVGATLDYLWPSDSLGIDTRASYGLIRSAVPQPSYITVGGGPRWTHNWSRTITSIAGAGISYVFSPERGTRPLLAPDGRASVVYAALPATFSLTYSTAFVPNPLGGQLIQSNQVVLSTLFPLSERARIWAGAGIGYGHTKIIALQRGAAGQSFDMVLSDVDVTWQVAPLVQLFARYQFFGQLGDVNAVAGNPSFLHDSFLGGVQLTSRPPGAGRGTPGGVVPTALPGRGGANEGGAEGDDETEGVRGRPGGRPSEGQQQEEADPSRRIFSRPPESNQSKPMLGPTGEPVERQRPSDRDR